MHRKIKTVESNFISFDDNQLSFSSRGISNSFDEISEIKSIEIKLKTITLTDEQLNTFIIYMDDYTEFKDKKSIKSEFSKLQSKILTMHNIK